MEYKRIMVPLDGSELAECVLTNLQTIARGSKTAIFDLVRVVPTLEMHYRAAVPFDEKEEKQINAAAKREAEDYLIKIKDRLAASGIINVVTRVLSGPVARTLADHLEKSGADLLVIATHGRSGPSRWVWGSVTEKLLHIASVPVMVVRPQECQPKS